MGSMKNKLILPVLFTLLSNLAFAQHEVFIKAGNAIQGYDPVAYFKENKAVIGKKEFSVKWREANWLFASKQNMKDFQANPEQYAPQFGGYCAYGMSEGHKAPTDADAWTIVDGKLYLNYNIDVRGLWRKDQVTCIKKANENWPIIKLDKD
jgi:hypothetical protein